MTLHGAIAAAVTPLTEAGAALDLDAFEPLVAFLAQGGIDGVLSCGTTGEGVLLSTEERRAATERVLELRPEGFQVAVHTGAQTTAETVALSRHAAEVGAGEAILALFQQLERNGYLSAPLDTLSASADPDRPGGRDRQAGAPAGKRTGRDLSPDPRSRD